MDFTADAKVVVVCFIFLLMLSRKCALKPAN